jgi:hypothetical protein
MLERIKHKCRGRGGARAARANNTNPRDLWLQLFTITNPSQPVCTSVSTMFPSRPRSLNVPCFTSPRRRAIAQSSRDSPRGALYRCTELHAVTLRKGKGERWACILCDRRDENVEVGHDVITFDVPRALCASAHSRNNAPAPRLVSAHLRTHACALPFAFPFFFSPS